MTRVLSGIILIAIAVGIVWFAPPILFFAVVELLVALAFIEYAALSRAGGVAIPVVPAGVATVVASIGPADVALMAGFVALGAITLTMWSGERDALNRAAASLFPMLYLGLPIGAMASLRALHGREALFLLMLTVMVSDTAQYYSGRAFGKRLLAPVISPKKTVEGAIGGFVCGALIMTVVGAWWLPQLATAFRALLGVALVALGIAGDLFESMLKRSAGVKDSSTIIPGHGGVLDRIDALLFAAPVYYIVLKYA